MSLFTTTIAPATGAALSNIMWATPIFDVRAHRAMGKIGTLNPIPYLMGLFCTLAWVLYGSLLSDGYIMWANFPSVAVIVYCLSSMVGLLNTEIARAEMLKAFAKNEKNSASQELIDSISAKQKNLLVLETGFWLGPLVFGTLTWVSFVTLRSNIELAKTMIGWIALTFNIGYFVAPLATMRDVIRIKDSGAIYFPGVCANAANASMWVVYGLTIKNPNVWVPNAIGCILQVVSIALILLYPHKIVKAPVSYKEPTDIVPPVIADADTNTTVLERTVSPLTNNTAI